MRVKDNQKIFIPPLPVNKTLNPFSATFLHKTLCNVDDASGVG